MYDERVRLFVSAWKERGLRRLARAAAEITAEVVPLPREPLTFVPADPDRGLQRGHHPAAALARELAEFWGADCLDLLARRVGRRQRGLPLAVRRANVRGAFRARSPSPRRIVLVDDVYTSGSTVNAAAGELKQAGARRVEVVTFARAVRGYYSETILTDAQGGRFATSDEGQERRGH